MIIKTRLLAGVAAFAVIASGTTMLAAPAVAAPTTPATAITNDPNAGNGSLNLSFYNSAGTRVTSGNDLTHLFDYALASSAARSGATRATLYFAFPDSTKANSQSWFRSAKSGSTIFPNSNAPAPLNSATNPLATLTPTDGNLAGLLPTTAQDKSAGYDGILQVRLYDSGPGVPVQSSPFWASDIYYDQAANTWQQVYPTVASATATTTTLGVTPAGPAAAGTVQTLTATVSPKAAGTVQFKDGATDLGSPVVVSDGTATTTATLAAGSHNLTAVFTPTDTTAFTGSTSAVSTYVVNAAAATATTTTLTVSPTSPAPGGTTETLTASVTPAAAGTVQFTDSGSNLGSPVTVSNGAASTTVKLASGSHSLAAVFTPTDTATYQGSTSTASPFVVDEPLATTTTLAVSPSSPAPAQTLETLTATVTSGAAGTVTFKDGGTALGQPEAVVNGTAARNVTLGSGSHSLTAEFTPADPAVYAPSATTGATTYVVDAPARPTTTSLTATPAGPQQANTSVTFTASVSVSGGTATGTVQFKDDTTDLGTPVALVNGSAQYTTTALTKGSHLIRAAYAPDSSTLSASSSPTLTYVIAEYPGTLASILATAYNQTATVSWAAPTNDGGTPVTGYALQQSTDGVTWTNAAPGGTGTSTATSKTVTGLTNGTGYFFRVAAINGIGSGAYRATTTKATPVADATTVTVFGTRSVAYNGVATLSTTVLNARTRARVAGVPVSLYRRVAGQSVYSRVSTATTSSIGIASARLHVTSNSAFQWRFAGNAAQKAAVSGVTGVTTVPKVSISGQGRKIKHGRSIKVYGGATPAPSGERVYLQQLVKGKWRTLVSTTIRRQKLPNGRTATGYAFSRKLSKKGSYSFRVTTAATAYSLAGASGRLTARAT